MITYTNWKAEESLITEAVGLLCESSRTDSLEHLMLQVQQGRQDVRNELAGLLSNYVKGILGNLISKLFRCFPPNEIISLKIVLEPITNLIELSILEYTILCLDFIFSNISFNK